jgi:ABC-2 type transport system permease protein
MNNYLSLIKREFWEHRSAFVITPLVMMALLIAVMLLGLFFMDSISEFSYEKITNTQNTDAERHISIEFDDDVTVLEDENNELVSRYYGNQKTIDDGLYAIHSTFIVTAFFIVFFYLLGALYNDRKDRSILFWKSMPVSELQTVTAKLIVGLIAVPLAFTFASWSIQLFYSVAAMVFATNLDHDPWLAIWPYLNLPRVFATQFGLIFAYGLWVLPISAWLLTASALAKRSPFLVATIPVVAIVMIEALIFETNYFVNWAGDNFSLDSLSTLTSQSFDIGLSTYLENVVFGLAITLVLLTITVWLRNNRFEVDT